MTSSVACLQPIPDVGAAVFVGLGTVTKTGSLSASHISPFTLSPVLQAKMS